jgi:hypothetical protein
MTAPATTVTTEPVGDALDAVAALAMRLGREDLATRLDEVARRAARTETVVCVVGEFKQGKSALINGFLGRTVCPVDDDLATSAVTIVRHADQAGVTVRRREAGALVEETIAPDDVGAWAMERDGSTDHRSEVELVDVTLPHPILEQGIALVDTPGVGGLNAGHAAATLAFLPSADALIFVTDASAELSGTELAFLASAMRAGPPVLVAITKVDMYPEWRRIVEIDIGHLRSIGLTATPFPLSSVLRLAAAESGDDGLDAASGYVAFSAALLGDAVRDARTAASESAYHQLAPALEQLREPLAAELVGLERPDDADEVAAELRVVRERLAALASADASWTVRLEDEFSGLRTRVTFSFSGRMRQIVREAQDGVETIDPGEAWSALSERVQEQTARAVGDAFLAATDGAAQIQATIAALLADEDLGLDRTGAPIAFDVREMWEGGPEFAGATRKGRLTAGFGVFTGAKAGVEMLGLLGTLLGAAIVGPAVLGVALAFGGKEVLSERRRQLTDRRQQARSFIGEFVEEVRFEADGRLAILLDEVQRQMRARFADRIQELHRTNTESAEALQRAAEQAVDERRRRLDELRAALAEIDLLATRVGSLGPVVVASDS